MALCPFSFIMFFFFDFNKIASLTVFYWVFLLFIVLECTRVGLILAFLYYVLQARSKLPKQRRKILPAEGPRHGRRNKQQLLPNHFDNCTAQQTTLVTSRNRRNVAPFVPRSPTNALQVATQLQVCQPVAFFLLQPPWRSLSSVSIFFSFFRAATMFPRISEDFSYLLVSVSFFIRNVSPWVFGTQATLLAHCFIYEFSFLAVSFFF